MKSRLELFKRDETAEQKAVITWMWSRFAGPYGRLLYAIPNGQLLGKDIPGRKPLRVHYAEMGVKPGMPDLCLPLASMGYHALYVEMKRRGGPTKLVNEQLAVAKELTTCGNMVALCRGSDAAIELISLYISADDKLKTLTKAMQVRGYIMVG